MSHDCRLQRSSRGLSKFVSEGAGLGHTSKCARKDGVKIVHAASSDCMRTHTFTIAPPRVAFSLAPSSSRAGRLVLFLGSRNPRSGGLRMPLAPSRRNSRGVSVWAWRCLLLLVPFWMSMWEFVDWSGRCSCGSCSTLRWPGLHQFRETTIRETTTKIRVVFHAQPYQRLVQLSNAALRKHHLRLPRPLESIPTESLSAILSALRSPRLGRLGIATPS